MRCRLFPALCVRWLKAGNSPSAQTARLFTLHLLQSLYRKQSEACPAVTPPCATSRGAFFFHAGLLQLQIARSGRVDAAIGVFYRRSFEGGRSWWLRDCRVCAAVCFRRLRCVG